MIRNKAALIIIIVAGALIRLMFLASVPPSLYWDEVAIGYDAWSLATTGSDMHGKSGMTPLFDSYGDYKAPGYIWLAAGAVRLLGPNEVAVRLPSVIAGILLIPLMYGLSQYFWIDKKIALTAAALTAVSPWAIHMSRAGFEANVGLTFLAASGWLFAGAKHRPLWWLLAAVTGALGIYSYVSLRLVLPGLLLFIYLWQRYRLGRRGWWQSLITPGLILLLVLPLLLSPSYEAGNRFRLSNRNVFTNPDFVLRQNQARELAGNTFFARLIYHRHLYFLARCG
jgi:4-amino-4-deoxy-L-arabinose transferase-like glycosyltransferase